jgi:molecular chaperone GrpE
VKVSDTDPTKITVDSAESVDPSEGASTGVEEHPPSGLMAVSEGRTEAKAPARGEETEMPSLEQALKEASENRDRWVRAVAELENYRKRVAQEKSRWQKYRYEDLLKDLLPVLDNMDRAVQHCVETERCDPVLDGLRMIAGMFKDLLARYGVTEIQTQGQPFDPQFHEGIARLPSAEVPPNTVIDQMEKGYMYHDRLLRPAKVVISTDSETT